MHARSRTTRCIFEVQNDAKDERKRTGKGTANCRQEESTANCRMAREEHSQLQAREEHSQLQARKEHSQRQNSHFIVRDIGGQVVTYL